MTCPRSQSKLLTWPVGEPCFLTEQFFLHSTVLEAQQALQSPRSHLEALAMLPGKRLLINKSLLLPSVERA